jgi:hypothetical protein
MGYGVHALGELECSHTRLVVQQGALVWVGGWSVHPRAHVHKDPLSISRTFHHCCCRFPTQPCSVHQVGIVEDPNPNGPLERRERIVKRAPHFFIVGNEAGSLTGALKKMA